MSYTPAPWNVTKHATPAYAPQYGIYAGESSNDHVIVKGKNAKDDAQLIAAAPELLAACELFDHHMWKYGKNIKKKQLDEIFLLVKEALSKAKTE